jgi:hypothetical protein
MNLLFRQMGATAVKVSLQARDLGTPAGTLLEPTAPTRKATFAMA